MDRPLTAWWPVSSPPAQHERVMLTEGICALERKDMGQQGWAGIEVPQLPVSSSVIPWG